MRYGPGSLSAGLSTNVTSATFSSPPTTEYSYPYADPKSGCRGVSGPIVSMYTSEWESAERLRTLVFQMLSSGKNGQPLGRTIGGPCDGRNSAIIRLECGKASLRSPPIGTAISDRTKTVIVSGYCLSFVHPSARNTRLLIAMSANHSVTISANCK